uniref:Laminin, beta 4 n=1 Tax=Cyprinus carpio TaxID=7962 RepID=A0A8C1VMQ1_CYPCA
LLSLLSLKLLIAAPVRLQDECVGNSCYPNLGDLMVGRAAQLKASSTCGLYRPQNYCILGYLENEQKCFICDSRSPYNLHHNPNSHRVENIITTFQPEHKMSWWQSENGVHEVSIQLDLESMFRFSHLILTFKSFRPAAMLVERSKDFGRTWKVFRYFAEDCANSFPGVSEGPADSIDDLICDSRYSGAEPSTDGEVVLKALDPTFDIHDPYDPTIQELITLTNLRVNFTRLITLGDTLLMRRRRNPQDKYYYALYEMVVRGSCFCNGHASQCIPMDGARGDTFTEPGMVHAKCVCQHNTAGFNCERCHDFYHDAPWRPGGKTDSDVCRRCYCHGHSEKCHFDLARYLATGGVSGGVCDDCRNNRAGPQCDLCGPYYYQDPQRSMDDPNACIPCECNPDGSVDRGLCDPVTGQCVCKQNVEGERCDRCKSGFYGFNRDDPSGCQLCRCNFMGTIRTGNPCDQTTGTCICEPFAFGPECDQCLPGYWGLGNTVYGCLPCDCDIGGALRTECSSVDGQCECRPNMVGLTCSEPAPGYFLAPLDFYIYEAEHAAPLVRDWDRTPDQPITWTGPGFVRVQDGAGLRFNVRNIPATLHYYVVVRYEPELGAQAGQHTLPEVCEKLIGSMSAFIHNGAVYTHTFNSMMHFKFGGQCQCKPNVIGRCCDSCTPLTYGLGPDGCSQCDCDPSGSTAELCDQRTGQCSCREGVTARRCDKCNPGYYGFPLCRRCQCNGLADICDLVTGDCLDCREHSSGPHCERCKDGYVGDPVSGQPCEPCLCPDVNGSGRFFAISCNKDPHSGAPYCECLPGHTGLNCDSCAPGYYGDLRLPGGQCKECCCNNNIDPHDGEACDTVTGECLRCLHNTEGPRCQSCKRGYYGNAFAQDCKECSCDWRGIDHTKCPAGSPCFCNQETGQCPCRTGVKGTLCNECEDGYWNLDGESGCQQCNCDPEHALNYICDKITGQCFCQAEYGGRKCDECGPNHFGNPDIQCMSCDCNMQGTIYPACDPYTGECLCKPGVIGLFCDDCAPGHDTNFPACEPCHACYHLGEKTVSDVRRDIERIETIRPCPENDRPIFELQNLRNLLDKLQSLANVTAKDELEKLEELLALLPASTRSLPLSLNASKLAEMTEKNITDLRSKLKEADAQVCQKHTSTLLLYNFNAYTLCISLLCGSKCLY